MLEDILYHKAAFLDRIDRVGEISRITNLVPSLPAVRSLKNNLINRTGVSLIAEIKRRSPSKGHFEQILSPEEMALIYEESGAAGISVLTEQDFFDGSIDDLVTARFNTTLPILRKDFIIDPYQIWESRYIGADAILLIAAILPSAKLRELYNLARQIGLEILIEVHNEQELERVLKLGPEIIGINNRDLKSFNVSLDVTRRLAPQTPKSIVKVSESGVNSRNDILELQSYGIDAVLIGEAIIKSIDKRRKIKELLGTEND
jgi:indole-3-glycerol phosphate synthase